jgi:hypothetical protein
MRDTHRICVLKPWGTIQGMKHQAVSVIGWYGVLAIISAYALVSFGIVGFHSLGYQLLNLTGAIAIVSEAYSKKDYQPVVLNILWSVIALVALAQIILH